jgi:hypothetical protein
VATILIIGLVLGLTSLRAAINAELTELANAILALSQGYTISGQQGCCARTDGSQAIDTPGLGDPADLRELGHPVGHRRDPLPVIAEGLRWVARSSSICRTTRWQRSHQTKR